jgi:hypothetical protein
MKADSAAPHGSESPEGNLDKEPWRGRFEKAGKEPSLQKIQLREYTDVYLRFMNELRVFAPEIKSERGVAFMLDLAFQMGTRNAKKFFMRAKESGPKSTESELLQQIARLSTESLKGRLPSGVQQTIYRRRQTFLTSPFLSDKALGY